MGASQAAACPKEGRPAARMGTPNAETRTPPLPECADFPYPVVRACCVPCVGLSCVRSSRQRRARLAGTFARRERPCWAYCTAAELHCQPGIDRMSTCVRTVTRQAWWPSAGVLREDDAAVACINRVAVNESVVNVKGLSMANGQCVSCACCETESGVVVGRQHVQLLQAVHDRMRLPAHHARRSQRPGATFLRQPARTPP